jgi:hypothetical protein
VIVSASRRTDIPAFYGDWLMHRLRAGEVLVRNPFNRAQVRRVSLRPEDVGGMVLWTRNPAPFMRHLPELEAPGFPFYFQVTLTPYGTDLEPGLPARDSLVRGFLELSARLGPQRVLWRYDPVLLYRDADADWHRRRFERLASMLARATARCTISFAHLYRTCMTRLRALEPVVPGLRAKLSLAGDLAGIAAARGIQVVSCADRDLEACPGVGAGKCVDDELLSRIGGVTLQEGKDPSQRPACRCARSVDIGAYDTCLHACLYCYAWRSASLVKKSHALHDPQGEFLTGGAGDSARITEAEEGRVTGAGGRATRR